MLIHSTIMDGQQLRCEANGRDATLVTPTQAHGIGIKAKNTTHIHIQSAFFRIFIK
jgi:hypothetical protein